MVAEEVVVEVAEEEVVVVRESRTPVEGTFRSQYRKVPQERQD